MKLFGIGNKNKKRRSTVIEEMNKRVVLAGRPIGAPKDSDFRLEDVAVAEPGPGEVLIRVIYFSLDPYMRGRMNDGPSYAAPVPIGGVMEAGGVGEVVASNAKSFMVGDFVTGRTGWQQYAVMKETEIRKVDPGLAPISTSLGVLGMPGNTAYSGLLTIGDPKPGETVVVSAASGAVGGIVGQIAKLKGTRVVGIAGVQEKCDYVVNELGFDACVSHHSATLVEDLRKACPKGIDVYFENVGGKVFEAILQNINPFCRIPVCGAISMYNATSLPEGPDKLPMFTGLSIGMRIRMQGFIVSDYQDQFDDFQRDVSGWIDDGSLKYKEDIVEGIESAVGAFQGLLEGKNFGKLVVHVGDDNSK
jgi:NADPH-dependent curcumin reductase